MDIGRVGIWTFALDVQPAAVGREAIAEVEELGYGALWIPEAVGREVMANAGLLLSATNRMVIASGIANMWMRHPMAAAAGWRTLNEAYDDRFLMGIGVSHGPSVGRMLKETWDRPLERMRDYLDAMDEAVFFAAQPAVPPSRVLAALGPKMLDIARERALGAHPYFVPVEHTAFARDRLGSGPLLAPEQAVVLETDPDTARAIARSHMAGYVRLPNYANNLLRMGFTEEDLADGGSDTLVDAIVAWGDEQAIADRVAAHHAAGADHVCIQVIEADQTALPLDAWRRLAPVLLG
ncbi:MAG: LLM class F420-dependent oxidoreductase [Acidimicrobiales bacterium]